MQKNIKELLATHYNHQVEKITRLDGYSNENYKIETDSANYVLKLYEEDRDFVEILNAENEVLEKLSVDSPNLFPVPQENSDGKMLFYSEKHKKLVRLLSYLEGECIGNVEYTPELLFSFGKTLAGLNRSLLGFRNVAIEARKSVWDLQYYYLNRKFLPLIENPSDRKLVEYFFLRTKEFAEPHFESLRKAIIQGDANEWNVLTTDGKVSGIIDFGDLVYAPLITELAIAIAYATLYVEDPIDDILPLFEGYNEVLPLEEKEIELLYYLIPLRLCISVCNAANARREMPENEYAFVTEKPAWKSLRKWIRLNPMVVGRKFKKATGLEC